MSLKGQQEYVYALARQVENTLEKDDIHLSTDDFNTLCDFLERITDRIKETGQ